MYSREKYSKWYYPTNNVNNENKKYSENDIMRCISKRLYMKNASYDIGIIF